MQERLACIRAGMQSEGVDAVLSTDAASVRYATGFRGEPRTLLITAEELVLYTSFRTLPWAERQTQGVELSICDDPVADVLKRLPDACTIGVDPSTTHARMQELQERATPREATLSKTIAQARQIKSAAEVECLRESQQQNEAVFAAAMKQIKPGISERAARGIILSEIARREELDGFAFAPIVAAGPNAWEIHHLPDDTVLRDGDMVIIDLGVLHRGYASDMTRTVCLGEPTGRMREIHSLVGKAQADAIAAINPGVTNHQIDAIARKVIEDSGNGRGFTHGLGHAIGMEVHDPSPALSAKAPELTLQPGMAFTIEPGIYMENEFGVRTEDVIIVTDSGCENITRQAHELASLPL